MAGYYGYSMSNNAVDAYGNGEMPISKWSKKAIMEEVGKSVGEGELSLQCSMQALGKLPVKALREYCLYSSSKHHTSKYYNMTEFYSLDIDRLEGLTDQELVEIVHMYKQQGKQEITEEKWKCSFLEWYGMNAARVKYPAPWGTASLMLRYLRRGFDSTFILLQKQPAPAWPEFQDQKTA